MSTGASSTRSRRTFRAIEISEHLPKLAQCADKFAILRGVSHTLAAHALGQEYVTTGNRPLPSLQYPVDRFGGLQRARRSAGPASVRRRAQYANVGRFSGCEVQPAEHGRLADRRARRSPFGECRSTARRRCKKRGAVRSLLGNLDVAFKGYEKSSQLIEGLDEFGQKAYNVMTSTKSKQAFDVSKESPEFAKAVRRNPFGGSCLLALRLVEAGTRFVTITYGGWDTHNTNWERLKDAPVAAARRGTRRRCSNGLEPAGCWRARP